VNGQFKGPRDAIEISRLVFPLLDGLKGGGNQQRMAAHRTHLDHVSMLVNDRINLDNAFDACMQRQRGILRLVLINGLQLLLFTCAKGK
jgi:hypothetical protein